MADEILTLKLIPPEADWYLYASFAVMVPRTGGRVSAPAVTVTGGHEVSGDAEVGTYDAREQTWVTEVSGKWVRQLLTALAVEGDDYRVDVEVTLSQGGREARSVYAPIGRLT